MDEIGAYKFGCFDGGFLCQREGARCLSSGAPSSKLKEILRKLERCEVQSGGSWLGQSRSRRLSSAFEIWQAVFP